MFDSTNVIRRLSETQKIRLLTDIHSLAEPELNALGVPKVRFRSAQDVRGEASLSPVSLARSWGRELMADVAEHQCRVMAAEGIDHVLLPEAKIRVTPFGGGLSEDPLLAGTLSGACLAGANRAGLPASLSGYEIPAGEMAWAESLGSTRNRYTFMAEPYLRASEQGACVGITVGRGVDSLPAGDFGYTLCLSAEGVDTVKALARGEICLKGSAAAVQSALHNYRRFATAIEHGKATMGELEQACAAGEAISEETFLRSLTRLLDFAAQCGGHGEIEAPEEASAKALRKRALCASTVLLANRPYRRRKRGILPLKPTDKICLLGDMASAMGLSPEDAARRLQNAGFRSVTYAKGYDRRSTRNDDLLQEALEAAKAADVVILLMGLDAELEQIAAREGRNTLPANQLALCDELSRLNRAVVAAVFSRMTPDMSFVTSAVHPLSAVLLAAPEEADGMETLLDILQGRGTPSGKLPVSLCAKEAWPDLLRKRKTGPFVGYRFYDSVGQGALYPFGHGLSYTSFRYSGLRVAGGCVSFTVKNTGSRAGAEVAQVYLGLADSAVLRPQKELIGFVRVELQPGEHQRVTIPLWIPAIQTEEGRLLTERGAYTLFVGGSVSDIRLQTVCKLGEDTLPRDGERYEDYLPSKSNIHSQHYYMEAVCMPMKPSLRNLLCGAVALCLAASVKIYDVVTSADALFLDVMAGILAVGAVAFFAMEVADRHKLRAEERRRVEEINEAAFADAAKIPVPSAAELFAVADDAQVMEEAVVEVRESDGEYDYLADVDQDMTFGDAVAELSVLAREKGVSVSEATLRGIFSALAVSNLAVVHGMSDEHFAALTALLGEYFGCMAGVDTVNEQYHREDDVLFTLNEYGNRVPRNALKAVLAAQREPGKIHLAALTNVDPATMSTYFVPYARHAHAPGSGCMVVCHGDYGEELSYRMSENLWFLLNLKPDAQPCQLPDYVAEIATVNCWALEGMDATTGEHSEFRRFSFGQMIYLRDSLRNDFSVDEDVWKKIDRLESYAIRYADFRIGNKHWLGMEVYMAVLMSLGVEESAALDEAMAVRLMPSLVAALSGRIPREDRGLTETLDALFGDDHTALCRKAIKESGADLT